MQAMAATLVVTNASLPDAALSSSYSQTLTATGGTGTYTWSIVDGMLPAGLSLNTSTGAITGTPTAAGNTVFSARVTDSDGHSAQKALAIKVNPALTVTTSALAAGVQNAAYTTQTLAAAGGSGVYTWSLSSGTLPAGLILTGSTGAISGTPTATGTANFTVQVTDSANVTATKALSINVSGAGELTIVTSALPNGTTGDAYTATLQGAGGTPPYTWSLSSGTLPAGLALNGSTGAITGTPTGSGTSNITVQLDDSTANPVVSKALSITVNAAVDITTTTLPAATAGSGYVQALASTGGAAPIIWSLASGSTLPAGLTLSGAAGVISGVPTTTGTFNFSLQAQDSNGVSDTQALALTVNAPSAVNITTTTLPNGVVGNSFTYVLQRSGGVAPFSWSVSPSLPAGLTLDAATGLITGTPTAVSASQSYTFSLQAGNGAGGTASDTQAINFQVVAAGALTITTGSLPNGTVSSAYSQALSRSGGTAPFTWTLASGSLPAGLTLSSDGVISGTPTTAQSSNFTVRVTDGAGTIADKALSITINATGGLAITTTTLPNAKINQAYSQTLSRTGGSSPFTWTLVGGSLPAGLNLGSTGVISGTPTTLQTASFTVRVTDNAGAIDDQSLSLTVDNVGSGGNIVNGDFYGPCKAFYVGSDSNSTNNRTKATEFRRLLDAAGVSAQVKAFCDVNGQKISNDDDEFRQMCNRLFSVSNTWRSRDGKDSSLRRLVEAAGAASNVRAFCQSHFGSFTGHECDDEDERDARSKGQLISTRDDSKSSNSRAWDDNKKDDNDKNSNTKKKQNNNRRD
jgi:hypothetical protein